MRRPFAIATVLTVLLFALLAACGPAAPPREATERPATNEAPPNAVTATETSGETSATPITPRVTVGDQPAVAAQEQEPAIAVATETVESDANGVTVGFTTDGNPFRGDPYAPVVMEEFSDFQCPFCRRFFQQTLPSLEENQIANGEVVLVFYDFPLTSIHPQAATAHEAANCAGDEGAAAFWAMHDRLFETIEQWSGRGNTASLFACYAAELALDADAFTGCMESNKYQEKVQVGIQEGTARGVNSTPSFFLNGQPLTGAQPLSVFKQAIATIQDGRALAENEPAAQSQTAAPAAAPTPAAISDEYAAAMGNPDAPVTIVEYTDYQCPYCARHAEQTAPQLVEQFVETGQVYYVLKDFPLDNIHPRARAAAVAARCAGEQNAYWEMHNALFASQPRWGNAEQDSSAVFKELAADLELDGGAFADCLADGRYDDAVEASFAEGRSLGINGTPSFFINGYPVQGAQPLELFTYAIDLAQEGKLAEAYVQRQPTPEPRPQEPVDIPLGDAPRVGNPDAPVVVVEYTDFQCPYCARHFQQTMPQIMENFVETGQVLYVFKDFPLTSLHPQAVKAAEAARCARDQEAYLAMHDTLFTRQEEWNGKSDAPELFTGYAEELGLDVDTFTECLQSGQHEAAIMANLEEGIGFGVRGTPGFFINGHFISGAQPYPVFAQTINQLLSQ